MLLANAADAEDATQEALLRAWRTASRLRDPDRFGAWLDRILVNICRDRLRSRRRIRFVALPDDAGPTAADPFASFLARDELLRAIHDLEPDERIVIVLHYWSDLTLDAIADRTGRPAGTVRSRLHRALERLRGKVPSGDIGGSG